MVDSLIRDVRYALRMARLNPGFFAAAVLSLALGAGANTAIFQLLDAVRLRTLPVAAAGELAEIRVDDMTHARGAWLRETSLTNPLWERIRQSHGGFSAVFAWADETLDISQGDTFRKVTALWVSGEFFDVLGVRPALGRTFVPGDDHRGCGTEAGVVLSDRFWRQDFGGDRAIVGRQVQFGTTRATVIGVAPPEFFGLEVGRSFDLALPICAEPAWHGVNARLDSGTVWWLTVMGRVAPGVSLQQAAAALRAQSPGIFAETLPAGYPAASVEPYLGMTLVTRPASHGLSRLRGLYAQPLVLLLGITALVLIVACVNLAHLLLARTNARTRELAIRLSLGASRSDLARQLIVESLAIAVAGVVLGLAIARVVSATLVSFLSTDATRVMLDVSLDGRTFAFAAALVVGTCTLFAALPSRRAACTSPIDSLRSAGAIGPSGRDRVAVRRLLLASQIALSLALLAGAALFVRTLRNLTDLDTGFDPADLVAADVNFADARLPGNRVAPFRFTMLERIRSTAGVESAAEALILPLGGGNWNNRMWMDGSDADRARVVMRNMIGPGFFAALKTPLVAGRDFHDADLEATAAKVAIVNERFTRDFGLGADALGRRLWIEPTPLEPRAPYEIVGVVANTKYRDLREDDPPIVYVPLWQSAQRRPAGQLVIRATGAPALHAVRAALASLGAVRVAFRPYRSLVRDSMLREELMAVLAVPFGALAIVLTAIGIYGVFSYTVARQTRDIAIRIALGADTRGVIGSLLGEAIGTVAAGSIAGLLLTFGAGRTASALLFGVSVYDPVSIASAVLLIAIVALAASYVPARRAARVDPAVALRHE
jgi:putative ABC transport system permease protein